MLLQFASILYFYFAYGVGRYYHFFAILILIMIMLFRWKSSGFGAPLWNAPQRGDFVKKHIFFLLRYFNSSFSLSLLCLGFAIS